MTNPDQPRTDDGELLEKLAAIEHERWADWQRWMMTTRCTVNSFGDYIIKADDAERWLKQCSTPYSELTEGEKQSDRDQVTRYWPLITAYASRLADKRAKEAQEDAMLWRMLVKPIPADGKWYKIAAKVRKNPDNVTLRAPDRKG